MQSIWRANPCRRPESFRAYEAPPLERFLVRAQRPIVAAVEFLRSCPDAVLRLDQAAGPEDPHGRSVVRAPKKVFFDTKTRPESLIATQFFPRFFRISAVSTACCVGPRS